MSPRRDPQDTVLSEGQTHKATQRAAPWTGNIHNWLKRGDPRRVCGGTGAEHGEDGVSAQLPLRIGRRTTSPQVHPPSTDGVPSGLYLESGPL